MIQDRLLDSEQIAGPSPCAADDPEFSFGDSTHRQIGFDTALVVEPLGVDRATNITGDRACRHVAQYVRSVSTFDRELGERGEVE